MQPGYPKHARPSHRARPGAGGWDNRSKPHRAIARCTVTRRRLPELPSEVSHDYRFDHNQKRFPATDPAIERVKARILVHFGGFSTFSP
ncbi:MAG: hypothetical protein RLZZ214_3533 [Verrucomicrobiota bacterium]